MNLYFLLALISLIVWVVLAFGMALATGWVHVPLALGAVLIAMAVVKADRRIERAEDGQQKGR